jgi:hypothetical protein
VPGRGAKKVRAVQRAEARGVTCTRRLRSSRWRASPRSSASRNCDSRCSSPHRGGARGRGLHGAAGANQISGEQTHISPHREISHHHRDVREWGG